MVRALSEWGTAQEPHAAAAPRTIAIAIAIVRLLFMFHLVHGQTSPHREPDCHLATTRGAAAFKKGAPRVLWMYVGEAAPVGL